MRFINERICSNSGYVFLERLGIYNELAATSRRHAEAILITVDVSDDHGIRCNLLTRKPPYGSRVRWHQAGLGQYAAVRLLPQLRHQTPCLLGRKLPRQQ